MGDSKFSKGINNNVVNENDTVYYAVHVPTEYPAPEVLFDKKYLHVYTNKEEVLKIIKNNKKARFKQFKSKKEAEEFAINGAEILPQDGSSAIVDSEKIMPFKRPKTEEMIQFRKDIERGDVETVKEKIFENPKYLVSNGDTPSILQEGSRYNALHIAARARNAKIAHLILDTITRIDFISYLYDENDVDSCVSRSEILLDRYLNTPDKGSNETPLHLASKHGAVEVVQILLSYPQCLNVLNRYNEFPKDIICSRVREPCEEAKSAIALMLEEQYFVPVLRSEDNSLQPIVGETFSYSTPLKLKSDLLSPRLEIQAYAGPMSKAKAELFKKKWKASSRFVKDKNSSFSVRLRDTEKGLEKTGRNLASELEVPWQEYWSFLDTFVDLSSENGLDLLEKYLKTRFNETFETVEHSKANFSIESLEKSFCSISEFYETFELCGSQDKQRLSPTSHAKRLTFSNSSSSQRENLNKKSLEIGKNYGKHPLVYVERFCEVFGKRIGTAISSCVLYENNHPESLKECLETQVKHLLTLIKSYREDDRFQGINFQLIHSRVATIAIENLQDMTVKNKETLLTSLKEIDWSDGALSDDEDFSSSFRNYSNECSGVFTRQLRCLVKNLMEHLQCCKEGAPHISPSAREETDCLLYWTLATPCSCTWGASMTKRARGGLKRKQCKYDCDCDCDASPRKIQFDNEKAVKEPSESPIILADYDIGDGNNDVEQEEEEEDHFFTPPNGNSDTEDMEDVGEIPNTFIYPGRLPTKTDFAVLEAIENVPLIPEKYPNIYLWRHILQMQPKNWISDHHTSSPECFYKKALTFDSPKCSPRKLLDRSFGSCESPPALTTVTEPWERVTGLYSPRRSTRSSVSILHYENSIMSR